MSKSPSGAQVVSQASSAPTLCITGLCSFAMPMWFLVLRHIFIPSLLELRIFLYNWQFEVYLQFVYVWVSFNFFCTATVNLLSSHSDKLLDIISYPSPLFTLFFPSGIPFYFYEFFFHIFQLSTFVLHSEAIIQFHFWT